MAIPARFGEGDTTLLLNILPPESANNVFEYLRDEVQWQTMFHRGNYGV